VPSSKASPHAAHSFFLSFFSARRHPGTHVAAVAQTVPSSISQSRSFGHSLRIAPGFRDGAAPAKGLDNPSSVEPFAWSPIVMSERHLGRFLVFLAPLVGSATIFACTATSGGGKGASPSGPADAAVTCFYAPLDASYPVGASVTVPGQSCPSGEQNETQIECTTDGGWFQELGATPCVPEDAGTTLVSEAGTTLVSEGGTTTTVSDAGCFYAPLDASYPVGVSLTVPGQSCPAGEHNEVQIECVPDGGWFQEPGATACTPRASDGGCFYAPVDASYPVGASLTIPGQSCPAGEQNETQIGCEEDGGWYQEQGSTACSPDDAGK
jgi:hypothetical protein